jgi:hypothetical protein
MASASAQEGIPAARRGRKATGLLGAGWAAAGVEPTPDRLAVTGLWLVNHGSKEGTYALEAP